MGEGLAYWSCLMLESRGKIDKELLMPWVFGPQAIRFDIRPPFNIFSPMSHTSIDSLKEALKFSPDNILLKLRGTGSTVQINNLHFFFSFQHQNRALGNDVILLVFIH